LALVLELVAGLEHPRLARGKLLFARSLARHPKALFIGTLQRFLATAHSSKTKANPMGWL